MRPFFIIWLEINDVLKSTLLVVSSIIIKVNFITKTGTRNTKRS